MLKLKRIKEILAAFHIDVTKVSIDLSLDLNDIDQDGKEAELRIYYDGKLVYNHPYDFWK